MRQTRLCRLRRPSRLPRLSPVASGTPSSAEPEATERPFPLWQKLAAGAYVLVAAGLLAGFHARLRADFWPLDASRVAPNILATVIQLLIATPIAVLLWPPFRRRLHAFMRAHTGPLRRELKQELRALHGQRERHHAEQMEALAKIHAAVAKPPAKPRAAKKPAPKRPPG